MDWMLILLRCLMRFRASVGRGPGSVWADRFDRSWALLPRPFAVQRDFSDTSGRLGVRDVLLRFGRPPDSLCREYLPAAQESVSHACGRPAAGRHVALETPPAVFSRW